MALIYLTNLLFENSRVSFAALQRGSSCQFLQASERFWQQLGVQQNLACIVSSNGGVHCRMGICHGCFDVPYRNSRRSFGFSSLWLCSVCSLPGHTGGRLHVEEV